MTPAEFRAQVHAAGPFVGHPFTPVSECSHPSSSGVDQAPFGDDKVWRCDVCGARYRSVKVDGCLRRAVPVSEDHARPCVGSFAADDGTRECLVHGGRITAEAPFAGCDER